MLNAAISQAKFDATMDRLWQEKNPHSLAVAVSGGADSMALAVLTHRWAINRSISIKALIVDHRLRPESSAEAKLVAERLAKLSISSEILSWHHKGVAANIQESARDARYNLMVSWCNANNVPVLCTAHHGDDQAETLLMRLFRGSGVDGLAGIPPLSEREGLTLCRPLLGYHKSALIHFLQEQEVAWVNDPSNENPVYTRTHYRQFLSNPAPFTIEPSLLASRLADVANHMARASDALDYYTQQFIKTQAILSPLGYASFTSASLGCLPKEIGLRVLSSLLMWVSGNDKLSRFEALEPLYTALFSASPTNHTLHECALITKKDRWFICREPARVAPQQSLPSPFLLWDNRFWVQSSASSLFTIGALTKKGYLQLREETTPNPALPKEIYYSLPVIRYQGLDVIAFAPHMQYVKEAGIDSHIKITFRTY